MENSKKTSCALWLILGLMLLSIGGCVALFVGVAAIAGGAQKIESGILEVTIRGPLHEGPPQDPFSQIFASLGGEQAYSLWDFRRALEKAAGDERVRGLRLDILAAPGWGVADEMLGILDTFRDSGKPIYAYLRGDFAYDGEYYLATAADQVWLAPATGLLVNGLRFEVEFFRGTFEKLHIEPAYLMLEEYKSAGEPFSRTEMSDAFREQLTVLGQDVQERTLQRIASRRQLETEAVQAGVDLGLLTGPEAMARGWVDRLGYDDELEAALSTASKESRYTPIPFGKYVAALEPEKTSADRIALVFGEGPITSSRAPFAFGETLIAGDHLAEILEKVTGEDGVKAIVFRVNSPGGSAVGSDHVWQAIERAQRAGIPVVVSMSDVAGSGGYWVAMGADRIVAQPNTITGSIGVVFGKLNLRGLYEWLGANVSDVTLAKNADILSQVEPLEPEHEERIRAWMLQVYDEFQKKVAEGRGIDRERVAELAKGRIWSGSDALELGLIDAVGGLEVALATARELADLPSDAPVTVFPAPRTFFEMLAEGDFATTVEAAYRMSRRSPLGLAQEALGELAEPRPWAIMPRFRID
jgi:protease-4